MSVSTIIPVIDKTPSSQPFQCTICLSRFTRHENLKRHASLHSRSQDKQSALTCSICSANFSRPDLRHRHMKRKHPEYEETQPRKKQERTRHRGSPQKDKTSPVPLGDASYHINAGYQREKVQLESGSWSRQPVWGNDRLQLDPVHQEDHADVVASVPSSLDDDGDNLTLESPFMNNIGQDMAGIDSSLPLDAAVRETDGSFHAQIQHTAILQSASFSPEFDFSQIFPDLPQIQEDWYPSDLQIARGCDLFFNHIGHFLPFLHRPTFDASQAASHLILSMMCLAYHYGADPDCSDEIGSGVELSGRCFQRARVLVAGKEDQTPEEANHNLPLVQTYLLLQVYVMMYLCGDDSAYGLKTHSKMITLARTGGLMIPLSTASAATEDLDSLWLQFVRGESHKRTFFAIHQIDSLWYQFLSIPRLLSHLEIKHDLPSPEDHWTASSSAEWAHRKLLARSSASPVRYSDAVRRFLSSDVDLDWFATFDPYGAINICQFLVSSAQEISGFSTMTGIISMERLGPLRSSLIALGPFIHRQPGSADTAHSAMCEATWEFAMIEMQMWSPSHTGGIVEGSLDAVLHQLTYLGPSCEFLCESDTAKAIQVHVDWFLRYLDATLVPDCEAPWVTLYTYKAFIIAWHLVRGGVGGAMQAIGISDGDLEGALAWARQVFRRREGWQLGKVIMACLDALEEKTTNL